MQSKRMQENIEVFKIDKKEKKKQTIKKNFFSKKIETVLYLLDKCLQMKVHKILECQTNVYVPTFM